MTDQEARCVRLILADRDAEREALRSAAREFARDGALGAPESLYGAMRLVAYGTIALVLLALSLVVFTLTL